MQSYLNLAECLKCYPFLRCFYALFINWVQLWQFQFLAHDLKMHAPLYKFYTEGSDEHRPSWAFGEKKCYICKVLFSLCNSESLFTSILSHAWPCCLFGLPLVLWFGLGCLIGLFLLFFDPLSIFQTQFLGLEPCEPFVSSSSQNFPKSSWW